MISSDLKNCVLVKVKFLVNTANCHYSKTVAFPSVFFDCCGVKSGFHKTGTIHFNPVLLQENTDRFVETTVPHEVAHYIQWCIYPHSLNNGLQNRRIHGNEWRSIMRLFGAPPNRTHIYDVSNVRRRVFQRFPVNCGCSQVQRHVTLKIVNKMNKGWSYRCRSCKMEISLTDPLTPE